MKTLVPLFACIVLAAPAWGADAPPSKTDKACIAAHKKVEQQAQTIDTLAARIAKDKRAREGCATQTACRKYDRVVIALERRMKTYETQMERYKADEAKVCKVT